MKIEVSLSKEDSTLFNKYSTEEENKKIPLLTMQSVVTTVLYDLEDEKACQKAMEEFEKDPVSYPAAEVWARLGLE